MTTEFLDKKIWTIFPLCPECPTPLKTANCIFIVVLAVSETPKGPRRTKKTTRSKFTTRSIFSTAG